MAEVAGGVGAAGQPLVVASDDPVRYRKMLRLIQRKARAQERLRQVEIAVDYELAQMRDEMAVEASAGEDR